MGPGMRWWGACRGEDLTRVRLMSEGGGWSSGNVSGCYSRTLLSWRTVGTDGKGSPRDGGDGFVQSRNLAVQEVPPFRRGLIAD